MIKELRVDDRLIHGQIALTWPKALGLNRIIVANNAAAEDKTQQMSLKMAVPSNVKALIRSVEGTIAFFDNPKAQDTDLMVIVSNVQDATDLAEALGDTVARVNLANVGRFDGVDKKDKIAYGSSILLNRDEQESLKRLMKIHGLNVVHQIIPDNAPKPMKEMMKS